MRCGSYCCEWDDISGGLNTERVKLRFFLDEGVPNSVGRMLEGFGHTVTYGNKTLTPGTPDLVVCLISMVDEAILVAMDKDMKRIAKANRVSTSQFAKLSFVHLDCPEINAAERVRQAMGLLEYEWEQSENAVRRLHLVIGASVIRTNR